MKRTKQLCLILGLTFWSVCGYAQYWSLTGNNGITTNDFLGTTAPESFALKTNNKPRLFLTQCSLVGLGTTTPQSLLHLHYDGDELAGCPDQSLFSFSLLYFANYNRMLQFTQADIFPSLGGESRGFFMAMHKTNHDFLLKLNEEANLKIESKNGGLTIDPAGNIGVYTDAPNANFHLHSTKDCEFSIITRETDMGELESDLEEQQRYDWEHHEFFTNISCNTFLMTNRSATNGFVISQSGPMVTLKQKE